MLFALAASLLAAEHPGPNPLHDAVIAESMDKLKDLLAAGGHDLEKRDALGYTSLMRAADEGISEAVRLLIAAGASVQAKDYSQATSLHVAAEGGMAAVAADEHFAGMAKRNGQTTVG